MAAADKLCIQFVPGAATNTLSFQNSNLFSATTDTVTRLILTMTVNITTASTTWYLPLAGDVQSLVTTETTAKSRMRKAGTLKNYGCYVQANRATTTTLRIRKNGGNGNGVVSITGGGAAGWYEDTSNTDTVSAGEDWNWSITSGTGADTLTINTIVADFVSTNGDGVIECSTMTGSVWTDNQIRFCGISGRSTNGSTEANLSQNLRAAFDLSDLEVMVSANTVNATSTVTLRKNAADTALVASITSNGTGLFVDNTNTVTFAATDETCYEVDCPSVAGTQTLTIINIVVHSHITANQNLTRAPATETVTLSESVARSFGATRPVSTETITLSESIARSTAATRNPIETTNIAETLARMTAAFRSIATETTTISDSVVRVKGVPRAPATETVNISDSVVRMLAATRNPQETTTIAETLNRMIAANRAPAAETTTISDSVARSVGRVRVLATEAVTINDSVVRLLAASRALNETATISDSVTRVKGAVRTIATETVVVSDSVVRMLAASRALTETTNITDSVSRLNAANRTIATETVTVNDSLTRMLAATRIILETTTITDSVTRVYTPAPGANLSRSITETVIISESITRMLEANRTLATETTSVNDSVSRLVAFSRLLDTENTIISDSINRVAGRVRAIIDNTSISESITKSKVL